MEKLKGLDMVALVLVIVGALNWGLVGFFKYDLVSSLFGEGSGLSRLVFALVGLAGLYTIYVVSRLSRPADRP